MFLSLDTFCRAADLAALFREKVQFVRSSSGTLQGSWVQFHAPKESRYTDVAKDGNWSARVWIQAYFPEPELCTVTLLERWMSEFDGAQATPVNLDDGTVTNLVPVFFVLGGSRQGFTITSDFVCDCRRQVLRKVGVDITVFKPHSTRHAGCTAARTAGDESDQWVALVQATGRWTSRATMDRFYFKPAGRMVIRLGPFPATVIRMGLVVSDGSGISITSSTSSTRDRCCNAQL
jgi:hypothetical protein